MALRPTRLLLRSQWATPAAPPTPRCRPSASTSSSSSSSSSSTSSRPLRSPTPPPNLSPFASTIRPPHHGHRHNATCPTILAAAAAVRFRSQDARGGVDPPDAASASPKSPASAAATAKDGHASGSPSSSSSSSSSSLLASLRDRLLAAASRAAAKGGRPGANSGNDKDDADSAAAPPPTFPDVQRLIALGATQRRPILLALVLLVVSSCVTLTVPLAIGKVIDFFTAQSPEVKKGKERARGDDADAGRRDQGEGSSSSSPPRLYGLGFGSVAALLLVLFGVGASARAGSNIMLELAGVRVIRRMRSLGYRNALRQDVEHADRGAGDAVSRLNLDTNIVGEAITSDVGDGLRAGVTVIFAGSAMFLISSQLTLLMMAVVPPAAIGAVFYGRYLRDLTHRTQDAVGQMTRTAEERLSPPAFRTITAFNTQEDEARRFERRLDAIVDLQTREAYASGLFYAGTGFVGNCAILTLLTYGGTLVSRGVITVGDLTSLLMYTAYLGGGLANLTSFFASVMRGVGAGARVFQLIDREPAQIRLGEGEELGALRGGAIDFEGVRFSYPSRPQQRILDGVDIHIPAGTSVALVGGSGVGKSSVHALLLRFYDPDQGSVRIGGRDLREVRPESVRRLIGVVAQDPTLFEGTVAENIAYGSPHATREQVERAAEQANCTDFIRALPRGIDTRIGPRQLSGGQRQRLAIARALVREPSILLLDEATSALDSASEYLVNRAIERIIAEGRITVWIVAHRLSTIKSAAEILVLDGGKIVESGGFERLDRPGTRFRTLMAAQLEASAPSPVRAGQEHEDGGDAGEGGAANEKASAATPGVDGDPPSRSRGVPPGGGGARRSMSTSAQSRRREGGGGDAGGSAKGAATGAASGSGAEQSRASVEVDELCVPVRPSWSVAALLEASGAGTGPRGDGRGARLSDAELRKLHRLAALSPPEDEAERRALAERLGRMVAMVDAVRGVEPDAADEEEEQREGQVPDGRVWPADAHLGVDVAADDEGGAEAASFETAAATATLGERELLGNARRTAAGRHFVVDEPKSGGGAGSDKA